MSQFQVINESTEDTLGPADNLRTTIDVARRVAQQGQAGDLITVLESGGKAVRQFVLLPDGNLAEQPIATRADDSAFPRAEQVTAADGTRQ